MSYQKMTIEALQELLKLSGDLFSKITQLMPSTPEKANAMTRLSEAGMWVRMAYEMDRVPDPEVRLREKPIETVQQ